MRLGNRTYRAWRMVRLIMRYKLLEMVLDELERYHRLLPSPAPEGLSYHGRMIASANIDDTPQKENIVLIVVDTEPRTFSGNPPDFSNWSQAFLLITDTQSYWDPKKKALFKLYDSQHTSVGGPRKNYCTS